MRQARLRKKIPVSTDVKQAIRPYLRHTDRPLPIATLFQYFMAETQIQRNSILRESFITMWSDLQNHCVLFVRVTHVYSISQL